MQIRFAELRERKILIQRWENYVKDKVFRMLFHEDGPAHIKNLIMLAVPEILMDAWRMKELLAADSRFESTDGVNWLLTEKARAETMAKLPADVVVTDIEATGSMTGKDRIIEIAACKVRGGKVIDEFHAEVKPEIPIPYTIIKLTGIKPEHLKDKPTIEQVMPAFIDFWGDAIFCAHDADFDLNFICAEVHRLGLDYSYGIPELCTLRLARKLVEGESAHGLKGLSKHFGYEFKERHKAHDDARATAYFLARFAEIADVDVASSRLLEMQRKRLGKSKLNSLTSRRMRKARHLATRNG